MFTSDRVNINKPPILQKDFSLQKAFHGKLLISTRTSCLNTHNGALALNAYTMYNE